MLQYFYHFIKEKKFISPCLSTIPTDLQSLAEKKKTLAEEISNCMSAKHRCVSLWNLSTAAREVRGLWRGQYRAKSRLCWPLCGQLGQAPFLRKQPGSGSSPPFVVLPTRWSIPACGGGGENSLPCSFLGGCLGSGPGGRPHCALAESPTVSAWRLWVAQARLGFRFRNPGFWRSPPLGGGGRLQGFHL